MAGVPKLEPLDPEVDSNHRSADRPDFYASQQLEFRTSYQQIFDVYLPSGIYHQPATQRLIEALRSLTEGATIYQAVEGAWYQEVESVHVLRLAITTVDAKGNRLWEVCEIRDAVRQVVAEFMIALRESDTHAEEAVFFNDWSARGTLVSQAD